MPSVMILESFGYAAATAEGMFAARFAINFAVSTLVSRAFSAQPGMTQTSDSGVRQQVPPSNTNSIPVVYGNAYVGGTFVDAVLSTDQQTMYYVMALSHAIEGGAHSYDLTKMYYGDQLITFNTPTPEQTDVISLTDTAGNVDTKIAGNLSIYLYYANEAGTITGYNTNYLPSSTNVMGSTGIDASLRWPSSGRQMNGLMFAIVKLKYNRDAGTTSLSPITFNITNNTYNGYVPNRAGDVWYDYMTNTKYGAAMDPSIVDTVSRDALNAYAQATIPYTPSGGGSATQARYKINGVIDTSKDCLSNIDQIMLACDSWNQYNATTGKWAIVINKAESTAFAFDDSNIVGDIRISAQDINQSINQIEAQFPNNSNKDQQDFVYIQTPSNLLYVNEPVNKYTIKYELVNNSVQAQYLANRQLEQAREDLIVTINTPYPGIQVDAGDVVSITNAFYGWNAKLFRVMKVVESATPEGGLGAALDLTEYNAQVYDNASITAFTPAPNSGLSNPNYFYPSPLNAPYVSGADLSATVPNFNIAVTMPSVGRVTGVTLYYRVNGSGSDWKVWLTQLSAGSTPFTPSSTFVFKDVVLPTAAYDFSYTVFNDIGGSAISSVLSNYSWSPYPAKIGTNLVSATNVVQTAIDVNNQYGGVPVTNYIGNWQQTVPNGVGLNLQSPYGDSLPLRLFAGSGGVTPVTVYPHMALIPLTAGLPTSSINGGVTFMGGHLYTNNGSAWNQVYQVGDSITPTFTAQSANTVLAGPTSGSAATPTFRSLVVADIPTLNQNTTGYAAFLQSATATGGTHTLQAYADNTNFVYGYQLRATGTTAPALMFLDGSAGTWLGGLRATSSTGLYPVDSAGAITQFSANKFIVNGSSASEVFYGNTTNSTPTINLYTSGTVNGYFSASSVGNLNLWNSRTGTGLLLSSGGGVNGLQFYAGGVYNIVLNAGNYQNYALPLSGGTLSGALTLQGYGTNSFTTGTGDGSSFSTYNFALSGWSSMAFYNPTVGGAYPTQVSGLVDFRNGIINMKGGFQVNGTNVLTVAGGTLNTGGYIGLNGGTTYGIGVLSNRNSAVFDTVESTAGDYLEFCYYAGSGIKVGSGSNAIITTGGNATFTGYVLGAWFGGKVQRYTGGNGSVTIASDTETLFLDSAITSLVITFPSGTEGKKLYISSWSSISGLSVAAGSTVGGFSTTMTQSTPQAFTYSPTTGVWIRIS